MTPAYPSPSPVIEFDVTKIYDKEKFLKLQVVGRLTTGVNILLPE
jgi:hypothetical protein